jgi:uncharacterized membrane protein YkvA (DUF1232 family)
MKNVIYDQYRKLIRNSKYRWIIIIASAAYILSPVDLLPELLLGPVGLIDDGLVATMLVTEVAAILTEKMKAKKIGSPRISVEDTRCGLKAIDNPREFRLLEIAYTHEGRE